jgi:hypothetical protein
MGGGEGIRGERILGLRRREEQEEPDIFLLMFVCAGPPTECSTWAGICILEFFYGTAPGASVGRVRGS